MTSYTHLPVLDMNGDILLFWACECLTTDSRLIQRVKATQQTDTRHRRSGRKN